MRKNRIIVVFAIVIAGLLAVINSQTVHAGGWAGSGGSLGQGCKSSSYALDAYMTGAGLCTYNGYGWVYYKYTEYGMQHPQDIKFGPARDNSGGELTIPSLCAEIGATSNDSGFYHFGIYAYKEIDKDSTAATHSHNSDTGVTTWYTRSGIMGPGAWGNMRYNAVLGKDMEDQGHDGVNYDLVAAQINGAHKFYDESGNVIAYSYEARREEDAWSHYKKYNKWRVKNGLEKDEQWKAKGDHDNSTITAFCYSPSMDHNDTPDEATFEGSVYVYVNGSKVRNNSVIEVGEGSIPITFKHIIERTDTLSTENATEINNTWSTSVWNAPTSNPHGQVKNDTTKFKVGDKKEVATDSYSVTVPSNGESIEYCQKLTYNKTVNIAVNGTTSVGSSDSAQACVKLKRTTYSAGTFGISQNCSVTAGGIAKGSSCDTEYSTNSKKWSISHNASVTLLQSVGEVYAGVDGSSNSDYYHGRLTYGVSGSCVRSHNAYTYFWWYADGTEINKGPTLRDTGVMDMPARGDHPANNYHQLDPIVMEDYWTGEWEEYWTGEYVWEGGYKCVDKGRYNGTYRYSSCTGSGGYHRYALEWTDEHHQVKEMALRKVMAQRPKWGKWYEGCEDTYTNWYDFDSSTQYKTWSKDDDSDLLLKNEETVSISRCSMMTIVPNYSSGSWSGSTSSEKCNTVTRWRRYAHFNTKASIKADTGIQSSASTAREVGYTLDTTGSDGKYTVTFDYTINRGDTDNWKDGEASKNFTVKNKWSTMESVSAADNSERIYASNGTFYRWSDYPTFESTNAGTDNVNGIKSHTVSGQLYYGQTIKICGNTSYGDVVKETDSGSKRSHIIEKEAPQEVGCIYIHRNETNCSNVVGNNPSATGYSFGHQNGYNVAKIGVINTSIGMTTPQFTNWVFDQNLLGGVEKAVGIWARPGDLIRYQVSYCMGANYGHAVHEANGINDGGVDTQLYMKGNSTARTEAETNKISEAKRSNYLFGDTVSTYDPVTGSTSSNTFVFTKRNSDGSINLNASLADSNTLGTLYSPDISGTSSEKKRYSCKNGGNSNDGENYYQIAGKVRRNGPYSSTDNYIIDGCAENRTQSLDVGRELSEQLVWTNMRITSASSAYVNGEYSHRAYVRVPYNYTAKPYLKNNSSPTGTVQIGGKMSTTPGIAVFPRKNCAFLPNYNTDNNLHNHTVCQGISSSYATYATVTKPTTVKFETYKNNSLVAGSTKTYVVRANTKGYFNGSSTSSIVGSTEADGGPNLDEKYIIDVPNDAVPGDKICIKMTITPADSHNSPTSATVMGASVNYAATEDTTTDKKTYWALRENEGTSSESITTCSTAVKRPTISVEGSNLYTATSVATSVVARKNNGTQYLYGSWSEYGIFGKVITSSISDIGTLGMGSGASYGYNQTSFYANHSGAVSGYNPQPLTVVTYNGGPKNGVHNYNYGNVTSLTFQRRITYDYQRNDDGSRSYKLVSNGYVPIAPSYYVFASMPIVNAGNSTGSAPKNGSTICVHSTQTFANNSCDSGQVGTSGVGSDAAESFTTNLLAHYNTDKLKTSTVPGNAIKYGDYVDITGANVPAGQIEGDENAAMYKYVKKAFLGYTNGADINLATLSLKQATPVEGYELNQTVGSSIIYKAEELVINSSIIANDDEKNNAGDFRMPIIIANKVWLTGNPTRIDAIIITNELNTCKWDSFNDFRHNTSAGTVSMSNLTSDTCNKTVRFTAPVVVKGKVILNRTAGAGQGDDQIRRAEIFELNPATYLWSYAEASRYSQAITTYSRELPPRY